MEEYIAYTTTEPKKKLVIENWGDSGFNLIVYPIDSTVSIEDHLQDTLEMVFKIAERDFGVMKEQWDKKEM